MKKVNKKYLIIGKFLKKSRQVAGLSQNDVKEIIGYKSCQLVSDWERGICGPPTAILHKLIKAYKLRSESIVELILSAERVELAALLENRKGKRRRL